MRINTEDSLVKKHAILMDFGWTISDSGYSLANEVRNASLQEAVWSHNSVMDYYDEDVAKPVLH